MRLNPLALRLACAGFAILVPLAPAFAAQPAASAIAKVMTDGDVKAPDDLIAALPIAAGERITDIILREDGQETSLLGRFQISGTDTGTVTRASTNPAVASKANHGFPRSAMPFSAKPSTCPPWLPSIKPTGANASAAVLQLPASLPSSL